MRRSFLLFLAVAFLFIPACTATTIVYPILDIATFPASYDTNVAQTFPGTGFVGMYASCFEVSFVQLFGLESTYCSRTILQVDISALAGQTINSATLTFQLLDGGAVTDHGILATSYSADGNLAYHWDPPDNLGTASGTVNLGPNSLDVTSLLAARLAASAGWFGLHLQGTDDQYIWTWTDPYQGFGRDRAEMRLTVDYNAIPEPGTCGLAAGALLALGYLIRRRRASR